MAKELVPKEWLIGRQLVNQHDKDENNKETLIY